MQSIGIVLLLTLLCVVLFATRRSALLAMVAGVLYLTQGQVFEIAGLHFFAVRILGFGLLARVLLRREFSFSALTSIDRAFVALYVYTTLVFLLRSDGEQANRIAETIDAFCCYFGFRGLIQGEDDLWWLLRALVVLLVPYVCLVGIERITGRNPFAFMGGVDAESWLRDEKTRCTGSFRYAVTLGTFAASFLALYVSMFLNRERKWGLVGVLFCAGLVWAGNSGGSFSAVVVAVVAWVFWRWREGMRRVRWIIVGVLVSLALVMKAPIWYIFSRGGDVFGGDGWHRSYLIDVALRHLNLWWLVGTPIKDTADWFPYILLATGGADITNYYLTFGLAAGVGAIALLIMVLVRAFRAIGLARAKIESPETSVRSSALLLWGLGSLLTVHVVNWFGVSYFDQIYVIWFLQLAAVASISNAFLNDRGTGTPEIERFFDVGRPHRPAEEAAPATF